MADDTPSTAPPFEPDDTLVAPYLDAHDGRLYVQRCATCGTYRFPPRRVCTVCGGREATWEASSGRGRVWSFAIFHKAYLSEFADKVPYNVAVVELEEGPRVISNIVGVEHDDLEIDLEVEATPTTEPDGRTVVRFRVAQP